MANRIDGGKSSQSVVSGLDQEELTLREKMAKQEALPERAMPTGAPDEADAPGVTPLGTGRADDALGEAAGGPAKP
jgi:hypothetical protein